MSPQATATPPDQVLQLLKELLAALHAVVDASPASARPALTPSAARGLTDVGLQKILKAAQGGAPPQSLRSRALAALEVLAEHQRRQDPGMTHAAAIAKAAGTPTGREAQAIYTDALRRGESDHPEAAPTAATPTTPESGCCPHFDELQRLADAVPGEKKGTASAMVKALSGRPDLYALHTAHHRVNG